MSSLLRSDDAGVVTLTLNRPESRNALTTELLQRLVVQLDVVADQPSARAVILAAEGESFCAGADLKEFAGVGSAEGPQRRIRLVTQVIARLRNLEQPTIAVVTGPAYGAGWGLALACDLTYASAGARFSLPEIPKGLRLPAAIAGRLVDVVGPVRAAEIALGGATYTAADGVAAGWVASTHDDGAAALKHATDVAIGLAGSKRSSVAAVKQVLRRGAHDALTPPPEYGWNEES